MNVNNPAIASSPRTAAFRLSCPVTVTFPVTTCPYPCTDGRPRANKLSERWGVNELNNVTNLPCGFFRYPTDPIAIGSGVHRGSVTKNKGELVVRREKTREIEHT